MPVIIAGILGLLVGSFLNVVIWRVPRGESVARPPSACPACGHAIRARDNVPVVSWLVLRGACRDCGQPISARYPAVELTTALAFAGVAWWTTGILPFVAYGYLAAITIALALIDVDVRRLPNAIVLPSYAVAVVLLTLSSWETSSWEAMTRALIGCGVLYCFYFALVFVHPAGMGFGDVKLAGVLGLYLGWVGWGALVVGAFGAFLLGGVVSLALLGLRLATRKSAIPFGPWMLLGAWVGLLVGERVWRAYLGLLGA